MHCQINTSHSEGLRNSRCGKTAIHVIRCIFGNSTTSVHDKALSNFRQVVNMYLDHYIPGWGIGRGDPFATLLTRIKPTIFLYVQHIKDGVLRVMVVILITFVNSGTGTLCKYLLILFSIFNFHAMIKPLKIRFMHLWHLQVGTISGTRWQS